MKYRFNGCELDTGARTLVAAGAPVHVEPQVFDLIRHLVENSARVVDKDELIARVWKGRIVSDATIASRLNAARAAVRDDGRRQAVIATLPRRGFRLVAEVSVEETGLGRPAIAVLPFEALAEDAGDRHLARGLADQLAGALGQAGWFDVRDTAASFADALAGMAPDAIARALDADYLVSGSLQATDAALRLTLGLTDARRGDPVWSMTCDGSRADVFGMQDRMVAGVLGEIEPRLRHIELQKSAARHGNFTAFDHYLRAADALRRMDLAGMKTARMHLDKAIGAHPGYAAAHAMHAWIGTLMLPQGVRVDARDEGAHYRAALDLGRFDRDALAMAGYAFGFFERDPLSGLDHVRRALALNPSAARAHDFAGWLLLYAGRADEALGHFDRALVLCPLDEFAFRMRTGRAFAHLFRRDFSAAAADARRAHAVAADYTVCHRVLAAALAHLGEDRPARSVAQALRAIHSGLTVARYARETRFEGTGDRQILFDGLRRAGVP